MWEDEQLMSLNQFFVPDKGKIEISLLLFLFYSSTLFLGPYFPTLLNFDFTSLLGLVILLPFSCAVMTVYRAKQQATPVPDKGLVILGFVIFLFITWLWLDLMILDFRVLTGDIQPFPVTPRIP
jgi:hypothetical protein